jgi:hypothetical protein
MTGLPQMPAKASGAETVPNGPVPTRNRNRHCIPCVERNREMACWFRFSEGERLEKREGFGAAQNGVEGVKEWFAENWILSRERAADPKGVFAQGAVAQTREQAGSAPAFAALVSRTNTRREQVLAGRAEPARRTPRRRVAALIGRGAGAGNGIHSSS